MTTLGERLRDLILEKRLKQKEFAKIMDIKAPTLHGYITNFREPYNETLIKFAEFFDVSLDYLVGRTSVRWPTSAENENTQNSSDDSDSFLNSPKNKKYLDLVKALAEEGYDCDDIELMNSFLTPDEVKAYTSLIRKINRKGIDPLKIIGFSLKDDDKL